MATWKNVSHGQIPPNALWGGKDVDGSDLYVGRAMHEGDHLPGKVSSQKGALFVPYGGREHPIMNYEVLVNDLHLSWQECRGCHIPLNAVIGGNTRDTREPPFIGEPLFIGRAWYQGSLTPGKVHGTHGKCYIPFGGKEIAMDHYEILINV